MGGEGVSHGAAAENTEIQNAVDFRRKLHFHLPDLTVKFYSGGGGIDAGSSIADVGGLAVDIHGQFAAAAHQFVFAGVDNSFFKTGPQMQTENRVDTVLFQHTCFADRQRTAGGFLTGLEDQQHIVGQALFFAEPPCQFQQNCRMTIVTASVHLTGVGGGVGKPCFFLDGQRVHIRAEGNGRISAKIKIGADRIIQRRKNRTI